ncbi:hypothetical protein GOBAR_DD11995 [Gossypium barbadense]|nr:hypothetical protein GOBAR_DD11995 [Gossypium barbadense]
MDLEDASDNNKEKIITINGSGYGKKDAGGVKIQRKEECGKGLAGTSGVLKKPRGGPSINKMVGAEESSVDFEVVRGVHESGIEKGISMHKNMVLTMKDITKKGHRVYKRLEQKQPTKPVLVEWIESLLKELDKWSKDFSAGYGYVADIEVTSLGIVKGGMGPVEGSSVGESATTSKVITLASGGLTSGQ